MDSHLYFFIQSVFKDFPGGIKSLVDQMNQDHAEDPNFKKVSSKILSNKLNPNVDTHKLTLSDLIYSIESMRSSGFDGYSMILNEISRSFGGRFVKSNPDSCQAINALNVLDTYMTWDKERGETYQKIRDALKDGRISKNEIVGIIKEMAEDAEASIKMRNLLQEISDKNILLK